MHEGPHVQVVYAFIQTTGILLQVSDVHEISQINHCCKCHENIYSSFVWVYNILQFTYVSRVLERYPRAMIHLTSTLQ